MGEMGMGEMGMGDMGMGMLGMGMLMLRQGSGERPALTVFRVWG